MKKAWASHDVTRLLHFKRGITNRSCSFVIFQSSGSACRQPGGDSRRRDARRDQLSTGFADELTANETADADLTHASSKGRPLMQASLDRPRRGNERTVVGMTDTTRRIVTPTKESGKWGCSDCAWSQPFVQRLEVVPNVPPKAIGDAFDRHKCRQHRHPRSVRAIP